MRLISIYLMIFIFVKSQERFINNISRFECTNKLKICDSRDTGKTKKASSLGSLDITIYKVIRSKMQYVLYSVSSSYGELFTHYDLERYTFPNVFSGTDLKVIIHGSVWNAAYINNLKDNYMTYDNAIVILVDWRSVPDELLEALEYTAPIYLGASIFEMLTIIFQNSTCYDKTHLIGHSYGAHIAGYTGRIFQENGIFLKRITGLDAADPDNPFQYIPNGLGKADAKFVDVINTAKFTQQALRKLRKYTIGHVDFYPNAGRMQPLCAHESLLMKECNSMQSYQYFAESIKQPRRYLASRCQKGTITEETCHGSTVYMGNSVDVNASGVYYINSKLFKRISRIF